VVPDNLQAEVRNGHVTLRGEVAWSFERTAAERAIRYLAGVHGITNAVTVRAAPPKADDVNHRVGEAIERMADLDARSIWVTTTNGTVQLHGHVHSLAERRIAGQAAASAPGVTNVENRISVTP
jgi:osmotically-inducible protein OsmY